MTKNMPLQHKNKERQRKSNQKQGNKSHNNEKKLQRRQIIQL